ncbi:MAG: multiprotein bridging factor aMBF1 [Candidatus Woesearchaeota archaeon]
MAKCELCGSKEAQFKTAIEGTLMHVCSDCSKYGVVKSNTNVRVVVKEVRKPQKSEPLYSFIPGYGSKVKTAREKLGLKQEEMAKRLNEKESLLHNIESEHLQPSIATAKKIERELHIKIVEEVKEEESPASSTPQKNTQRTGDVTLGDFIKRR